MEFLFISAQVADLRMAYENLNNQPDSHGPHLFCQSYVHWDMHDQGSLTNAVDGRSCEHVVIICMPRVQINIETPCTLRHHTGGYAQTQF